MKFVKLAFFIALSLAKPLFAQVDESSDEINIFANVCEKISSGESKSSARLRASDKASFKAVEEIPELKRFREYLDPHQFNLKIYKLIDNYLEDMSIDVISQSSQEVCVEVSAYLLASSVNEVFQDIIAKDDEKDEILEVENENIEENVNIIIPPKPEININEQIAYDDLDEVEEINEDNNQTTSEIFYINEEKNDNSDKKISIFVDKTSFYNNTSTNGFFAHIEQEILKKGNVVVQAKFDNPNYILKTNVLKAKVDNINAETSRLHIVVGLELTDTSNSEITTEHQNRFILFNASEDAQTEAASLVKKLLSDGIAKILPHIQLNETGTPSGNIITPPSK